MTDDMPKDARVPAYVIADKQVDYDREILAILGHGYRVGKWQFAPPSLGVWSLWEIIDSPCIKGDDSATFGDYWRVLWINATRKGAVQYIAEWLQNGKPGVPHGKGVAAWKSASEMDRQVIRWVNACLPAKAMAPEGIAAIDLQIQLCSTGYEMIPGGGKASRKYLFAGEAYGAICSNDIAEYERLVWDTPMCLFGHVSAHKAACNGASVGRPKDPVDRKRQIAEANEREARGELHQWQREYPDAFPPSPTQCKFPSLLQEFEQLLSRQKTKKTESRK